MAPSTFLFLALLWGCAAANIMPWVPGECQNPHLQQNFQPRKYFRNHWYHLRSFGDYLLEGDGECAASESKITPSGRIDTVHYQFLPLLKKYIYVKGHTDVGEFQGGKSTYTMTYDALFGLANVKIPFSVVATDYTNYAVVYSCKQILGFKSEMSWILTRKRGSNDHNRIIKKAVQQSGLTYSSYLPQFNTDCGPNEPTV